jgi:hypothetical protein
MAQIINREGTMIKCKQHILLLILNIFLVVSAQAQSAVSIQFGTGIPLSDFGSEDLSKEGAIGAGVGIDLGVKYFQHFPGRNIGFFTSLDIQYNQLTTDAAINWEEDLLDQGATLVAVNRYKLLNIPIGLGLQYHQPIGQSNAFFISSGVTLNVFKLSNYKVLLGDFSTKGKFNWTQNVGFRVGGGFKVSENFSINADYFFVKHNIPGTLESSDVYSQDKTLFDTELDLQVNILSLTFALHF